MLTAFIVMHWQGVSANILSLGGVAIALAPWSTRASYWWRRHKHVEYFEKSMVASLATPSAGRWMAKARSKPGPALFFSLLVITLSLLPVFTLEAQEGRLFSPLAFTKTYAMARPQGLSVTLVPVLMGISSGAASQRRLRTR